MRTVTIVLWTMTALVVALGVLREMRDLLTSVPHFVFYSDFFFLDGEANLPTWYSSSLMLLAAAFLYRQYRLARASGEERPGGWLLLALGFLWLSFDETARFHDALNVAMATSMDVGGILARPWILVGIPVVAIVGVVLLRFLLRLPARTRWLFLASGTIYLTGVFVMEALGGVAVDQGYESVPYKASFIAEEALELAGLTLFALAVMDHVARATGTFRHTVRW